MKVKFDKETGILFYNGVRFSSDMIANLKELFVNSPKAFEFTVEIKDTVTNKKIKVGRRELQILRENESRYGNHNLIRDYQLKKLS